MQTPHLEHQASVRPERMRRQARLMRLINAPMRAILRLPFPTPLGGALMLVSLTGRKTGKRYEQPVSYVRDGDSLLTPGGGKWTRNLNDGQPVRLRLRGKDVWARPTIIKNPDDVERLLRRMAELNPRVTSFVPVGGHDGKIDRVRVETAVRYGFAVIRWQYEARKDA